MLNNVQKMRLDKKSTMLKYGFLQKWAISKKLGCVIRIVVGSILSHAEFRLNDHRKDALPCKIFDFCEKLKKEFLRLKWPNDGYLKRVMIFNPVKWGASSRWSSSLYCPVQNSGQMTIGKTHSTLYEGGQARNL